MARRPPGTKLLPRKQCLAIVSWEFRSKLRWNCNKYTKLFTKMPLHESFDFQEIKRSHDRHKRETLCRERRPFYSLQCRHNGVDGVSYHQPYDCLLYRLFRWYKKASKLRVTGLCVGNSPVTGEFPAQMASNTENVSIWWRRHAIQAPELNSSTFTNIHIDVSSAWSSFHEWFLVCKHSAAWYPAIATRAKPSCRWSLWETQSSVFRQYPIPIPRLSSKR